ncbi:MULTISPECIES: DegT/DnrJ/EryC1/StrS aminotransferase family protein [Actinosynnema]|uniref:DegT/DnrJ/EryC1/StrS family aminotransferase n=1 Tax=Actinosynnema TaxID=40566 RepID=UPI0020A2B80A|nr:DegT/DnrJ/EryC1/StrS family aminotransferase [Actinosynnema pretiosum]MCP2097431.1 perosamine synthetase [Actinosynnema pretiosum]
MTTLLPTPIGNDEVARNARPVLHGPEYAAVAEVLASGHYGHGPTTEAFERALADHLQVPEVVTVASGTVALQIALQSAGIDAGDEVLVPSLTFCASVQAILATGAHPRFVEVDPRTLCVRAEDVLDGLTETTRAVMPVLYGGRAVDLSPIRELLHRRDVVVVEDAAHAFGSRHRDGRPVGAGEALTCFSFDPIKNLTCGEGGAVVPATPEQAHRARRLRALGIVQDHARRAATTTYQVDGAGLRAHLPAINAAIGQVQLAHFAEHAHRRVLLWKAYRDRLTDLEQVGLVDVDIERTVPFNTVVLLPAPARETVFAHLRAAGIGVGVHYPPNHLQPAFARWRRPLPVTEELAERMLTLPLHPRMDRHDVDSVVDALASALAATGTDTERTRR